MATQPEKKEEKSAEEGKSAGYSTFSGNRGWLYGLGTVIIALLIFLAGIGVANHRQGMVFRSGNIISGPGDLGGFRKRGFMAGGFGSKATLNGESRARGVVTAVNGSSFTLAGNGATTNVTTNSSTQYRDGNTVKQNDTVVVLGTESNGSLTATQVTINP